MSARHEFIEYMKKNLPQIDLSDIDYERIPQINDILHGFNNQTGNRLIMRFEIHLDDPESVSTSDNPDPKNLYVMSGLPERLAEIDMMRYPVVQVQDSTVIKLPRLSEQLENGMKDNMVCTCEPDRPVRVGCPVHFDSFFK